MTNAELEEVICELHRRIALTTAGTPLQDDLIKAVGALRIAVSRIAELEADKKTLINVVKDKSDFHATKDAMKIAELEAQMPKEGECEAKKPKTVKETEYSFYCDCPTCRGRLISNVDGEWCAGTFDRFCRMCGQKIDWSEYCGWSNKPNCGARMKGEQE